MLIQNIFPFNTQNLIIVKHFCSQEKKVKQRTINTSEFKSHENNFNFYNLSIEGKQHLKILFSERNKFEYHYNRGMRKINIRVIRYQRK